MDMRDRWVRNRNGRTYFSRIAYEVNTDCVVEDSSVEELANEGYGDFLHMSSEMLHGRLSPHSVNLSPEERDYLKYDILGISVRTEEEMMERERIDTLL